MSDVTGYGVYYVYDDGSKDFVESFTVSQDAYAEKHKLEAELEEDDDADGVRVVVIEESS